MIRSPQALLVSLFLHLLGGVAMLAFIVPSMSTVSSSPVERCSIALSRVVPVMPAMDAEPVKRSCSSKPAQKAAVQTPPVKEVIVPADAKPVEVQAVIENTAPEIKSVAEVDTAEAVVEESLSNETLPKVATAEPERAAQPMAKAVPVQPANDLPVVQTGERYLQEHIATIAALLQGYLYYPRMARKRHIEGEVLAVFTLEADGTVSGVSVKKHARAILDNAAIQTIESLSGLFPNPQTTLTLEVPIRFVLK